MDSHAKLVACHFFNLKFKKTGPQVHLQLVQSSPGLFSGLATGPGYTKFGRFEVHCYYPLQACPLHPHICQIEHTGAGVGKSKCCCCRPLHAHPLHPCICHFHSLQSHPLHSWISQIEHPDAHFSKSECCHPCFLHNNPPLHLPPRIYVVLLLLDLYVF